MGHENFHLEVLFGVLKFLRTISSWQIYACHCINYQSHGLNSLSMMSVSVTQIHWHEGPSVDQVTGLHGLVSGVIGAKTCGTAMQE